VPFHGDGVGAGFLVVAAIIAATAAAVMSALMTTTFFFTRTLPVLLPDHHGQRSPLLVKHILNYFVKKRTTGRPA
jgi:hypothetical protein